MRKSNQNRPTWKNVGLPCSYLLTQNRPFPKRSLPFWESLFSFFVFSNSVNKLFFKISKSCISLIEERLHRLLLYAFLPYIASISSCVLGAQKNPLIEMVLLRTQNTCFGPETKKCKKIYLRSFQNESVQLQWQARILTFSKHPPFWSCAPKFYIRSIARVRWLIWALSVPIVIYYALSDVGRG